MARLPPPDMIISAYAYCSTGQQWDEITYRLFGKQVPIFKVSSRGSGANKPDAGYMQRRRSGTKRSRYVAEQLRE